MKNAIKKYVLANAAHGLDAHTDLTDNAQYKDAANSACMELIETGHLTRDLKITEAGKAAYFYDEIDVAAASHKYISFRISRASKSFNACASGNTKQRRASIRKWLSLGFSVEKSSLLTSDFTGSSQWLVTKTYDPKCPSNVWPSALN